MTAERNSSMMVNYKCVEQTDQTTQRTFYRLHGARCVYCDFKLPTGALSWLNVIVRRCTHWMSAVYRSRQLLSRLINI